LKNACFRYFFLTSGGRQLWEEVRDTAKLNLLEKWIVMMWSGFKLGQGGVQLFSGQLLKLEYLQKGIIFTADQISNCAWHSLKFSYSVGL
jgi:hypothetical protein